MTEAGSIIAAVDGLTVPQGPLTGRSVALADFQKQFIEGAFFRGAQTSTIKHRQICRPTLSFRFPNKPHRAS
jgi:hypothetical protein